MAKQIYDEKRCSVNPPTIHTTRRRSKPGQAKHEQKMQLDEEDSDSLEVSTDPKGQRTWKNGVSKKDDLVTFKMYLDFTRAITALLAHQILAINRAEERGVISVKMTIHPIAEKQTRQFMLEKYFGGVNRAHWDFVHGCFSDSWKRLIEPHLVRTLRSKLTTKAQDTSLEVFTDNFRRLLMTAPLRATTTSPQLQTEPDVISSTAGAPGDRLPVVGLDPGWAHGCKWAACDPHGAVLSTGILWPPIRSNQPLERRGLIHQSRNSGQGDGLAHLTTVMRTHK
ncbi:unnamed protein product [Echinostoma caproni]|uniref:Tex_YqgF domain-containing protein n=1 Tax=Echinostoma caproni TaxID=27848 RepID=A0A183B4G4_9TREM|nr:unnamed protein product [Echinostoma caproni]